MSSFHLPAYYVLFFSWFCPLKTLLCGFLYFPCCFSAREFQLLSFSQSPEVVLVGANSMDIVIDETPAYVQGLLDRPHNVLVRSPGVGNINRSVFDAFVVYDHLGDSGLPDSILIEGLDVLHSVVLDVYLDEVKDEVEVGAMSDEVFLSKIVAVTYSFPTGRSVCCETK